jgi:hypothetical protein
MSVAKHSTPATQQLRIARPGDLRSSAAPERPELRVVAFGGGVQSTALLALAAERRIDFDVFLFANVGDDSEHPATLDYLHGHAQPFAARHGLHLHELRRTRRDGTMETLYGRATAPAAPAAMLLDLRLSRAACAQLIRRAGLPVPPKSACWFCPFHRPSTWAEMRRDDPELFARAAALEDLLNTRRAALGRDPVWLTRFNAPLTQAIRPAQDTLPGVDDSGEDITCDNEACWT